MKLGVSGVDFEH